MTRQYRGVVHEYVSVDWRHGVVQDGHPVTGLTAQQLAVLATFATAGGRVVGRTELQRRVGLSGRDPRRCDSLIVGLRRALGSDAFVTVRGRGWRCLANVVAVPDTADRPV